VEMGILAGMKTGQIYTSSLYLIENIGNSSYPYLYLVNARILRKNGDRFRQYSRIRIYLSSLLTTERNN